VPELRKDKARDRDRMKLERKLQKKWANTAARRGARQQVRFYLLKARHKRLFIMGLMIIP
jgi:hypothetical protein